MTFKGNTLRIYDEVIGMNETCKTCAYFQQHYVKAPVRGEGRYGETPSGHCIQPRLKLRYSHTKACQWYRPVDGQGTPFA